MLTTALQTARSGLATASDQIAVLSRNVSNANNLNATRKIAVVQTAASGGVAIARIDRTAKQSLLEAVLGATSSSAGQDEISAALAQLQSTIGQPTDGSSPAALIGELRNTLQTYSSNPASEQLGNNAVSAAARLSNALNDAAVTVQHVRESADNQIAFTRLYYNIVNGCRR